MCQSHQGGEAHVEFPPRGRPEIAGTCDVGCRTVPAQLLRDAMDSANGLTPSYRDLLERLPVPFRNDAHRAGWRLEDFVVDLLLGCQAGYVAASRNDPGLSHVFARRTGPIAAAIAITIDDASQAPARTRI